MNIKLEKLTIENIEIVRNWRNSKDVSSYMYSNKKIEKEDQKSWFEKENNDNSSEYWIITYDNNKIGLASLTDINLVLNSCYWAFYLGDTSIRGMGIGSKIEYSVMHYVFEELKLNKLRCEVFTFNDNVIKMHEKFGFRREAYYREHCIKNEKWQDVVGLAITQSEWNNIKERLHEKTYKKA